MLKKRVLGLLGIFFFVFLFSGTFDFAVLSKNSQATKAEDRLRAWEKQNKMKQSSPFKNIKWRPVGPKFQGGRVESITSYPGNSATIYVGFGAGNIWKLQNPTRILFGQAQERVLWPAVHSLEPEYLNPKTQA